MAAEVLFHFFYISYMWYFGLFLRRHYRELCTFQDISPCLSFEAPQSQSIQSARISGRSSELAPPPPQASVSPPGSGGGDTVSLAGDGGEGSQFRRRERHWYFMYESLLSEPQSLFMAPGISAAAASSSIRRRCLDLPPPGSGIRIQCSPTRRRRIHRAWSIEEGRSLCEGQSSRKLSKIIRMTLWVISWRTLEVRGVAIVKSVDVRQGVQRYFVLTIVH